MKQPRKKDVFDKLPSMPRWGILVGLLSLASLVLYLGNIATNKADYSFIYPIALWITGISGAAYLARLLVIAIRKK